MLVLHIIRCFRRPGEHHLLRQLGVSRVLSALDLTGDSASGDTDPPADLRSPCGVAFFETASFEVQGLPFCKREGSLLQKSKDSSPAFRRHYRPGAIVPRVEDGAR